MSNRAVFVSRHGGPEVLELREADPGAPGPGQARVRVHASGVNFIDTYLRTGAYPRTPPFVLGFEGSGEVEAVGAGVTTLAPGARVAWAQVPSSYADVVNAPVDSLVALPDGVPFDVGAAAMLQGMTAHYLTHEMHVKDGATALVHAAAGGTGRLLVQMLRARGVRVIGTCGSDAKAELARSAGASDVIRYDQVDFSQEARRLTQGRGVDVAYDSVGKSTFDASLKSLAPRGTLVLFGQASGAVPPLDPQRLNQAGSVFLTRPALAHYVATPEELRRRAGDVLGAIAAKKLEVRIDRRLPLTAAGEAHRILEGRGSAGKLLLVP